MSSVDKTEEIEIKRNKQIEQNDNKNLNIATHYIRELSEEEWKDYWSYNNY